MNIILVALMAMFGHAVDTASWERLHARLLESQNYYPSYNLFFIENIAPDKIFDHQADYFETAKVIVNADGTLTPVGVRTISETWKLTADGTWDIDQWKHTADDDGNLLAIDHYHIIETQDSIVLLYQVIPEKPATDPEEIAVWESVLARWYTWNL